MRANGRNRVGQPVAGGAEFKQDPVPFDEFHYRRVMDNMYAVADSLRTQLLLRAPQLLNIGKFLQRLFQVAMELHFRDVFAVHD